MAAFRFAVLLGVLCSTGILAGPIKPRDVKWDHHVVDGDFSLSWTVDGESISLEMTAPIVGWVGVGVAEGKDMSNADIAIGWVDGNGEPQIQDSFSSKNGRPTTDTHQDVTLLDGSSNATHTTISFSRLLDTGDTEQDRPILPGPINLIYAWGEVEDDGTLDNHHGNTGHFQEELVALAKVGIALNDVIDLGWQVAGDDITFEVVAATTGWVGIGFSAGHNMEDADIIIGWVQEDGTPVISDQYSEKNTRPTVDTQQDVTIVQGSKNATHTNLTFSRKLDTGDEDQDRPIKSGNTNVIFAWSDVLPTDVDDIEFHHDNAGEKTLQLIPEMQLPRSILH